MLTFETVSVLAKYVKKYCGHLCFQFFTDIYNYCSGADSLCFFGKRSYIACQAFILKYFKLMWWCHHQGRKLGRLLSRFDENYQKVSAHKPVCLCECELVYFLFDWSDKKNLRVLYLGSICSSQSCKSVPTVPTSRCYFFWPVLIFGKSTRKTVLLCPWLISLMP